MKFVPEFFEITSPSVQQTAEYIQKVYSETNIKNIKKKQTVTRHLNVEIEPLESKNTIVAIKTEKEELTLDSILKKQENISKEIAKTIDFVQFKVNPLGEIIRILNQDEILNKWYPIKRKLMNEYRGKNFDAYVSGIEKKIENHDALLEDFKQYRLFGGLFNAICFEHSTDASKYNQRDRAIDNFIFNTTLNFKESVLLDKIGEEEITLKVKGDFDPEKKDLKVVMNEFDKKGIKEESKLKIKKYSGSYLIDKNSNVIKNMQLTTEVAYGADYYKKIEYSLQKQIK